MRKVIRKRVRRTEGAINLAADIDAVIAINTGDDATTTRTVVRSARSVVQDGAGRPSETSAQPDPDDPPKEKP